MAKRHKKHAADVTWTADKPTAAGWYLMRPADADPDAEGDHVEIQDGGDGGLVLSRNGNTVRLASVPAGSVVFSGPVDAPEPDAEGDAEAEAPAG